MKSMKRMMLAIGVLTSLGSLPTLLAPAPAEAVCLRPNMEVARVDFAVAGNTATIFLRPASTAGATFFTSTANVNAIGLASDAVHTRTKVTVVGNAAVCPAAGGIGTLLNILIDP